MGKNQNVRFLLEYDGSCFGGWQRVDNGKKPSIQGTLEQVLKKSLTEVSGGQKELYRQEKIQVIGSGRTDAGVHALRQVANVHLPLPVWQEKTPEEWRSYWNDRLPAGLRIRMAEEAPPMFHSRYDAVSKVYGYVFDIREVPSAFAGKYAYWIGDGEVGGKAGGWNWEAVQRASMLLTGEHDFSAFSSNMEPGRGTVRTITRLEWKTLRQRGGEFFIFVVEGNGFLYHMVRILAGTLYEVGAGRRKPESILEAFRSGKRQDAGLTLPGYGLFLKEVSYV